MSRGLLVLCLLTLAACGATRPGYLKEGEPTATLLIGHQEGQTWHREMFDLYLLEVGNGCLDKTRVPVSTSMYSSTKNRTVEIPAGTDVTFMLEHDSPYDNVHYECNLLFSVDPEAGVVYRLTYLQDGFEKCAVKVEQRDAQGEFHLAPSTLLVQRSVEEDEVMVCDE